MLEILKSVLKKNPRGSLLLLAVKGLVFGILFWAASYNWFVFLLFLLGAVYFYLNPIINSKELLAGFLILLTISLILIGRLPISGYRISAALFFGFLWFLLLGIKNLIFINRQKLYYLLNSFLLLLVFMVFFYSDKSKFFTLKYLAAGTVIFMLLGEFFRVFSENAHQNLTFVRQPRLLMNLVISFLAIQLLWTIALLPIGFINASALALLSILSLENFSLYYLSGSINRRLVLRDITVFLLLGLMIFGVSSWQL